MPATYDVIAAHQTARSARWRRNYLRAARSYRMCHYYYNNGELGDVFYFHVQTYGESAYYYYLKCKSKLTDEVQRMLENEEESMDWKSLVKYDDKKILSEWNMPSPNRPTRIARWWKNFIKTFSI